MAKSTGIPVRLDAEREQRLKDLRLEFALGTPSAKHFDLEEMTMLRDDLSAMLGEIVELRRERHLMAMLAADEPMFFNPLVAWDAQALRDRILAEAIR